MPRIAIDREKCKGCLLCISFCPRGLIKLDDTLNSRGVKPVKFIPTSRIRKDRIKKTKSAKGKNRECLGCLQCALICPDCCIEVYK